MARGGGGGRLLKDSKIAIGVSDDVLDKVGERMQKMELKAGDVLVKEGQPMPGLFCIETGMLERVKSHSGTAAGEEFLLDTKEAGSVTGLLHVLKSGKADPAFATIKARGESTVWCLSRDDLETELRGRPDFAMGLLGKLAEQMRGQSKVVAHLKSKAGATGSGGERFEGVRVMCYDSSGWVRKNFQAKVDKHNEAASPSERILVDFTSDTLSSSSASAAVGYDVVCLFVNDVADGKVLQTLGMLGVGMVALRCAGFDRVDVDAAQALGLTVARVPAYSPYAVAEHAVALLMALNRQTSRASARTHDANFSLDGLCGFDVHGKTVAVIGCGRIGQCLSNILLGFGVKLLCVDAFGEVPDLVKRGATFVALEEVWPEADVVFLQVPLLPSTRHMINDDVLPKLKKGMTLINTSRGGLVDTETLIKGLRSGVIRQAGLDVYENEAPYFFKDCSDTPVQDPLLSELLSFNNVLLTGHQAFFTQEAIDGIVNTTFDNISDWRSGSKGKAHKNSIF
ncbi:2-hydroxyacid dehydrogenase [Ectocarpus siliculosus]|uniref:2-hydroxyacid dehydrogenase n=1 Tax=Ectocarpus siliculosus TaxID=2880 RepID=D7FNY8_ECTSI|nr:2-hydroxyacid dehydrogenase [Ectocarpus siliculosus]|eukprot:CBJ30257.1 2-hydroxyacid dehydrogenase [Ectocarpus siliculosus]